MPVDRLTIASDIKNGITYITIYSGNKSWKKGQNIQTFFIDGIPYLRIDGNKVKLDNLGDLPNVTSMDVQSLGIISEDDANELNQIEQLEKQIQELESKSLSRLKQTSVPEKIVIDQNNVKSRKQQLEEYENEYLNRIKKQKLLLEEIDDSIIESEVKTNSSSTRGSLPKGYEIQSKSKEEISPEQLAQIEQLEKQIQELESQPEPEPEPEPEPVTEEEPEQALSPRGSLPKESSDELPQELDLAPEPVTEEEPEPEPVTEEEPEHVAKSEATPEQLAQIEQLEKQIQELESQPEPEPEPEPEPVTEEEPGTLGKISQVSSIQKQIDDLENMLSFKFEDLSQTSKPDSNLNMIKNDTSTNSSEKENEIMDKLDSQKEKLNDIERKINDLDPDDAS